MSAFFNYTAFRKIMAKFIVALSAESPGNKYIYLILTYFNAQSADEKERSNSLSRLKDILKDSLKIDVMQAEIGVHTGSTYMISQSDYQGLICSKLYDPEQELIYMGVKNIENLTLELFAQVIYLSKLHLGVRGRHFPPPPLGKPLSPPLTNLISQFYQYDQYIYEFIYSTHEQK